MKNGEMKAKVLKERWGSKLKEEKDRSLPVDM